MGPNSSAHSVTCLRAQSAIIKSTHKGRQMPAGNKTHCLHFVDGPDSLAHTSCLCSPG